MNEYSTPQNGKLSGSVKKAIWGVLWIVGACWFLFYSGGNPLHEIALIQHGKVAPGFIIDTWEDVEDDESGRIHWFHGAVYKYYLPDGREFTERTKERSGRLGAEFRNLTYPYPVEVEYLQYKPTVSRIRGDGHNSTLSWLLCKVVLGCVLLILFCTPGIILIRDAVRDFKYFRNVSVNDIG